MISINHRLTVPSSLLFTCLLFISTPTWAIKANIDSTIRENTFLFVESNIEQDYFVTPMLRLDPRMTGSSSWTSLKWQSGAIANKQRSLGYVNGYTHYTVPSNRYYDMWLDNPPVNRAITAMRCLIDYTGCPTDTGYLLPELVDNNGFYKVSTPSSGTRWNHGLISDAFYHYLHNLPVGSVFDLVINSCWTTENYDPHKGERCKDSSSGTWHQQTARHLKGAHLKLISTNALSEVFIDSEGNPLIGEGALSCHKYTQSSGTASTREGLVCKLVDIELQIDSGANTSSIDFSLQVDESVVPFSIAPAAIRFSYDGNSWSNLNSSFTFTRLAASGSRGLYVYFSNAFFKQMATNGLSDTDTRKFLRIVMDNSRVPESGYYEFMPSNHILIKPRHFGVSIISDEFIASPEKRGSVGVNEAPIDFNYIVTTSGKSEADEIRVQVTGPTGKVYNRDFCLFSAENDKFKVPFPGYLFFVRADNSTERIIHNCNGQWYDITHAQWTQTPWDDGHGDGLMSKTRLRLSFPMDDSISHRTTELDSWEGYVSASGEIRISATWRDIE